MGRGCIFPGFLFNCFCLHYRPNFDVWVSCWPLKLEPCKQWSFIGPWLFRVFFGDYTTQLFGGVRINHDKDLYDITSISMESKTPEVKPTIRKIHSALGITDCKSILKSWSNFQKTVYFMVFGPPRVRGFFFFFVAQFEKERFLTWKSPPSQGASKITQVGWKTLPRDAGVS